MREYQVQICEGLGVKFPGPTRRQPVQFFIRQTADFGPAVGIGLLMPVASYLDQ
jgi:hypothetical protein